MGPDDTQITECTYDYRNRLTGVAHRAEFGDPADWAVDYVYDTFNRRISRTLDANGATSGGQSTEYYVWDGGNVVLDFLDADGPGATSSPELSTRYLHGPAVDQLLAQEKLSPLPPGEGQGEGGGFDLTTPGAVDWFVTDNLGSTRSLVDSDGAITATYSYDTFGRVTVLPARRDTRYLYTCQEYDLTTGLYYYNSRWYDPATGRFVVEDLIGFSGGDENLYRYVGNGPTNHADPSGKFVPEAIGFGLAIIWLLRGAADNANAPTVTRGEVSPQQLDYVRRQEQYAETAEDMATVVGGKVWGSLGRITGQGLKEGLKRLIFKAAAAGGSHKFSADLAVTPFGLESAGLQHYLTRPGETAAGYAGHMAGWGVFGGMGEVGGAAFRWLGAKLRVRGQLILGKCKFTTEPKVGDPYRAVETVEVGGKTTEVEVSGTITKIEGDCVIVDDLSVSPAPPPAPTPNPAPAPAPTPQKPPIVPEVLKDLVHPSGNVPAPPSAQVR